MLMHQTTPGSSIGRLARRALLAVATLLAALPLAPGEASAQALTVGDFDICDYCGNLVGNTARIRGRAGFGSQRAQFVLVNGATDAQDVDRDGYDARAVGATNFTNLIVSDTTDFVNVSNPDQVIARANFVLADFLNPLNHGFQNQAGFFVNIPNNTPAGVYRGRFVIRDTVEVVGANPNGEALRVDAVEVEIEVLPNSDLGLVEGDTNAVLDSLVLRGRPGQTISGVVRLANLGNVALQNVRFDVTDLIATSGTGLRIRRERISFTPTEITSIAFGDTLRVTITVRIPVGLLAGRYTGELLVQADGVPQERVPITVIVETPGEIVFETNPVVVRAGDRAVIIFNADPGTEWELRIFDMMALTTYAANGTVFEEDQAVRFTWPLVNGRGENVAGGMYQVLINVTQDGQRRQLRGKLMVIR